jgi:hypothetical protein
MLTLAVIEAYVAAGYDNVDMLTVCYHTMDSMSFQHVLLHHEMQACVIAAGYVLTGDDQAAYIANRNMIMFPSLHLDLAAMATAFAAPVGKALDLTAMATALEEVFPEETNTALPEVEPIVLEPLDVDALAQKMEKKRLACSFDQVVAIAAKVDVPTAMQYAVRKCPFKVVEGALKKFVRDPEIRALVQACAALPAADDCSKRFLEAIIDGWSGREVVHEKAAAFLKLFFEAA